MSDKIKVLFLSANSKDTARLQIDEELRAIFAGLQEGDRSCFEVAVAPALRTTELPTTILRENPDIIHYSGHGSLGELQLAADADNMESVPAADLARIFKTFANRTRCVVLNACFSATVANAIAASIPVVVGMLRAVPDSGAREFAAGFYSALANGGNLTQSFIAGQERLARSGSPRDLAQIQASAGTADTLYFIGPRAQPFNAAPPHTPKANPWAVQAPDPIGFQQFDKYAQERGFVHSTNEQIQEFGDITISNKGNKAVIRSVNSVTSAGPGSKTAVTSNSRQEFKAKNFKMDGEGGEFTSELISSTGGTGTDGKQKSDPLERLAAQLRSLTSDIMGSSEIEEGLKPAIKAMLDKLINESLPPDEVKKKLKNVRRNLDEIPALLTKFESFESALLRLF